MTWLRLPPDQIARNPEQIVDSTLMARWLRGARRRTALTGQRPGAIALALKYNAALANMPLAPQQACL
jgi:hypothetical protein